MKNIIEVDGGLNINSWCENIDENTMEQIKNVARHPKAFSHVVLNADGHMGYGMPIGGVCALKNAISPTMIGYDIACTDMDTEYLTRTGWKKISEYNNENIMIYDKESDACFFSNPSAYIVNNCDEFFHLDSPVINQVLSDEHNVLLFSCVTGKPVDGSISKWIDKNKSLKKGVSQQFKNILPNVNISSITLTDEQLMLIIAISADGCIRPTGKIEFHLKKQRKILRLKKLLNMNGIVESEFNLSDGSYGCSFDFSIATKDLSFLFECNKSQAKIVLNEAVFWDGHVAKDGQLNYYSTIKTNIDAMQYIFALCDIRANFYKQPARDWRENCLDSYILYSTNNKMTCFPKSDKIKRIKSVDGKSYCFTTSTGYWIMRRGDKIVITGNCGMSTVNISIENISRDSLNNIKELIKKQIPVGMSRRQNMPENNLNFEKISKDMALISDKFSKNYMKDVKKSLGTLGGGKVNASGPRG